MKVAIKAILILGIVVYAVIAIAHFRKAPEDALCTGVEVVVNDENSLGVVTPQYIEQCMTQHKVQPEGKALRETNLDSLCAILLKDPYISHAECHYNADSRLCIHVAPMQPLVHIMTASGKEFYTDTTGIVMPIEKALLNVCVATGHINTKDYKKTLLPLVWYIAHDAFWKEEVMQIDVDRQGDISLVPRSGEYTLLLGKIDRYEEKLANARLFYEKGFPQTGWNKYEVIDLRFKGQVIGRRRPVDKQ